MKWLKGYIKERKRLALRKKINTLRARLGLSQRQWGNLTPLELIRLGIQP